MDWLKDKKNQPVIAIVAAVIIVGVLFFVLRPMIFGGGSSSDTTAAAPDAGMMPMATDPNAGVPAAPSPDASATPAQPVQTAQVSTGVTPMEPWRADPFLPVGYKPPKKEKVRKLPIVDFPFPRIPLPPKERDEEQVQDVAQPARRMAGLLLNNRVYAIVETNGSSEIVQPGDTLKDRLAVVEKIEQDKVVLKTTGKKPTYIVVRMAASPRTDLAPVADTPSRSSGGGMRPPGGPMMPPMPGPPGGRSRNRM
ncbi:MAG: hypothetical protein ACYC64_17600 [Armatimonadota bacterium]